MNKLDTLYQQFEELHKQFTTELKGQLLKLHKMDTSSNY